MSHNYFVRITHPYANLEPLVHAWSLLCDRLAVYEHEGARTGKVHCHLLVVGSRVEKKQLRNVGTVSLQGKEVVCSLQGNAFCSFKPLDPSKDSIMHTLTYCAKGKYDPYYFKDFDWKDEICRAFNAWVQQEPPAYMKYQDCMKGIVKPTNRLEWARAQEGFGLQYTEDLYNEFVYRTIKGQVQSYCMKKYRAFTQACQAEVKMLICTIYFYHDYQLPSRLERVSF